MRREMSKFPYCFDIDNSTLSTWNGVNHLNTDELSVFVLSIDYCLSCLLVIANILELRNVTVCFFPSIECYTLSFLMVAHYHDLCSSLLCIHHKSCNLSFLTDSNLFHDNLPSSFSCTLWILYKSRFRVLCLTLGLAVSYADAYLEDGFDDGELCDGHS